MKFWFLAVSLFATSFEETFREGLVALNGNDLAIARARLEVATQLKPESGEAWAALAQTYVKLNDLAAADNAAAKAKSAGERNFIVLRALLLYYTNRRQPKEVIDVANKAIALNDRPELHDALARAYFELGQGSLQKQDFNEAAQAFEQGLKAAPQNAQLVLALGVAYYGQRRFPEAIDRFLQTIALAPEVEQPYIFLGKMLDHAGDRMPEIEKRFRALPPGPVPSFLLAKVVMRSNAIEAEKLLRQSIAAKADFWESHFELGVLLFKSRKFEESARELERAIELNPKDATAHYHLARAYDRLGKPEKAAAERAIHANLSSR